MLILGIVLTVLSIFISYYAINNNQEKIDSLNSQAHESKDKINQLWQKQQELEHRHAISIMLYALVANKQKTDPVRQAAESYVKDTLEHYEITNNDSSYSKIIKSLPAKLKEARSVTIDRINDLYSDKIILETSKSSMQKANELYKVIGLLMQVVGLILVLYFRP
ncbi:MAG: hypothetical protein AAF673_01835 [Pseudomonadota bacterium]